MVSERKRQANRRNAKKSTGPRTAAGKKRSSRNATLHGVFAAGWPVLPFEREHEYRELAEALERDYAPVGIVQRKMVSQIAQLMWKIDRIAKIEAEMLLMEVGRIQRNFRRAQKRAQKRATERGKRAKLKECPEFTTDQLLAAQFLSKNGAFERLEMYHQRLQRTLHATQRRLALEREQTNGEEMNEDCAVLTALVNHDRLKRENREAQAELKKLDEKRSRARGMEPSEARTKIVRNEATDSPNPQPDNEIDDRAKVTKDASQVSPTQFAPFFRSVTTSSTSAARLPMS